MSRKQILFGIIFPAAVLLLLSIFTTRPVKGKVVAAEWKRYSLIEEKWYPDAEGEIVPFQTTPFPGIKSDGLWVRVSRLYATGSDHTPIWPAREIKENQRIIYDKETFLVTVVYENGFIQNIESNNPAYNNYLIGMPIDGIFNGLGFLVDYSPKP